MAECARRILLTTDQRKPVTGPQRPADGQLKILATKPGNLLTCPYSAPGSAPVPQKNLALWGAA